MSVLSDDDLAKLIDSLGGSEEAMRAIDYKRGPSQTPNPQLDPLPPAQLGQADRYAWGAEVNRQSGPLMALLGSLPVAGYEAVKGVAQTPDGGLGLGSAVKNAMRKATFGTPDDTMELNERTSPASIHNIIAYIKGAIRGDKKAAMPEETVKMPPHVPGTPRYIETRKPGEDVPPEVQAFLKSRGK